MVCDLFSIIVKTSIWINTKATHYLCGNLRLIRENQLGGSDLISLLTVGTAP